LHSIQTVYYNSPDGLIKIRTLIAGLNKGSFKAFEIDTGRQDRTWSSNEGIYQSDI